MPKQSDDDAYIVSPRGLRMAAILERCEAWLIPQENPDWPLSLAFWIPAHLADEVREIMPPREQPASRKRRGNGRSKLELVR